MPDNNNEQNTAFVSDDSLYGKKVKVEAPPGPQIGIDTQGKFFENIISAGLNDQLDMSALDSFLTTSRSRDQVYSLIDQMSEDPIIAAVLETYAEDATETNENGDIIWAEADDVEISKFVNWILKAIKVNKNAYSWAHSLIKYGDLYLRLYRKSEYEKDQLFNKEDNKKNKSKLLNEDISLSDPDLDPDLSKEPDLLTEDVNVRAYSKNDPYINYIEMVPNPAEVFELTKFGTSYAYIKADINSTAINNKDWYQGSDFLRYNFQKNDINVYEATEFVHGYLEDDTSRTPEQVKIIFDPNDDGSENSAIYKVRRGQSMLYSAFKAWRELKLLENSVLLNRVTKSSIVRILGIEVGDMPKEMVQPHLQGIKSLIEQKSSLNTDQSMNEYTNPGPIENNIYVPTHNGVGAINMQTIGGDVDVKGLADLDYYKDRIFGCLKVPKQYFGFTDDNAGFSGGQSLSIISSRYAKTVIRIQNTLVQALTDAINLILINKGLSGYINKFTIKMQKPVTQDDIDRRDNMANNNQVTGDIMNLIGELVEDNSTKLKILKSLLSKYLINPEILEIIQNEIDKLEKQAQEEGATPKEGATEFEDEFDFGGGDFDIGGGGGAGGEIAATDLTSAIDNVGEEIPTEAAPTAEEESGEETLPTPSSLGLDFTDSNNPEFQ